LREGKNVELAGKARGLEIVVLAAPTSSALSDLIEVTPELAPYRASQSDTGSASGALPAGSRYVVTLDANDRRKASVRLEIAGGVDRSCSRWARARAISMRLLAFHERGLGPRDRWRRDHAR
jgi:hypothetical protein